MAGITIDIKGLDKIITSIGILPKKFRDGLYFDLVDSGQKLKNYVQNSFKTTKKDMTRYYYSSVRKRTKVNPSYPGNPPGIDSGELFKSIVSEARGTEVETGVVINAPYGKWLEMSNNIKKKRPFLQPAIDRLEPEIKSNIEKKIKEIAEGAF